MVTEPGGVTAVPADLPPTKEKQEKALTLFCARAGHNNPQCGLFRGFPVTLFIEIKKRNDAYFPKNAEKARWLQDNQ